MEASKLTFTFIFIAMGFVTSNCEDQSAASYEEVQLIDNCSINLKRIETFNNALGTVTATHLKINPFIIEGVLNRGNRRGPLAYCNLPAELEIDGLEIMFSGFLYEVPPTIQIIGYPFEFTQTWVVK